MAATPWRLRLLPPARHRAGARLSRRVVARALSRARLRSAAASRPWDAQSALEQTRVGPIYVAPLAQRVLRYPLLLASRAQRSAESLRHTAAVVWVLHGRAS